MSTTIPTSVIVATRRRPLPLRRMLESLILQAVQPFEVIVVDASEDLDTRELCEKGFTRLQPRLRWVQAETQGAAAQRNQGVALSTQPFIWFVDDDIVLESECLARMWKAMEADSALGGVNAMITNQRYQAPGFVSRTMFTVLHGRREKSFAGKIIGPAVNLLPEDREDLPEIVPVEWLNLGCTIYRKEALPSPPFDSFFTGYSLMEDVTLSLRVAKAGWKLANARTARIFHDSQGGEHKDRKSDMAGMELINRYYVMTNILRRNGIPDMIRLALFQLFHIVAGAYNQPKALPAVVKGKLLAVRSLLRKRGL